MTYIAFYPLLAAEVEVTIIWIVTFELDTHAWENKQNTIFAANKKIIPAHFNTSRIVTWMQ